MVLLKFSRILPDGFVEIQQNITVSFRRKWQLDFLKNYFFINYFLKKKIFFFIKIVFQKIKLPFPEKRVGKFLLNFNKTPGKPQPSSPAWVVESFCRIFTQAPAWTGDFSPCLFRFSHDQPVRKSILPLV